jgi:hypothetical protein
MGQSAGLITLEKWALSGFPLDPVGNEQEIHEIGYVNSGACVTCAHTVENPRSQYNTIRMLMHIGLKL